MDKLKAPQQRSLNISDSVINAENRTVELAFSSEAPYARWYGVEILDHSPDAVDLSRMNGGAALLLGHDASSQIGVVERAWIGDDRIARASVRFSRSQLGEEIFQDVQDGIRRLVSVGYEVNDYVLESKKGDVETYRMTKWTPFEVSIVPVPADHTVGIGRDFSPAGPSGQTVKELPMSEKTAATETTPAVDTRQATSITTGVDPLQQDRERAREIRALARQFGQVDMGDAAIDNGVSLDAFRAQLLSKVTPSPALRMAESPEIGMSKKDVESFSFTRALLAAADPMNAWRIAPFEMECSLAAQDKRGDSRDKTREAAITIPVDVLSRGIALNDGMADAAMRMMQGRRDLTVGAPTGGGNLVATELLGSSFIELLRNAMVLDRLGATFLRDLNGNVAIPSQTGAATGYWVTEGNAPTESQQTIGQVALTPKTVGAFTDYSRRLLLQSSIDVEAFVRADLAMIIAHAIQAAAINGTGAGVPTGILNTSGIGAVVGGTDGLAPTYAHMVGLESAVANVNADMGNLAYLTNSKVRGKLRTTEEFSGTNGKPVWTSGRERGMGEVLGYEAYVTNAVPSDLVKGTSSVASAIIFGNWADLLIGMWGGLDVMLDPYSGATSGTKRVVALQDCDIAMRHVASFAAMKDALTA